MYVVRFYILVLIKIVRTTMEISALLTDEAILVEIGLRITQRRIERQLTQADLAAQAGVSKRTIERIEDGASAQMASMVRVFRVLDLLPGLEQCIPRSEPGPVELLQTQGKPRQRARRKKPEARARTWTWDEGT